MRRLLCSVLLFATAALLRADEYGREIAERHARRAGDRLAQLQSLYAEGRTLINNEVVPFKLWARRPNQLRVESFTDRRRALQLSDGRHEPWISHTDVAQGAPQEMSAGERKDFLANADFDGALVDFAAKGYTVDYAGEDTIDGRKTSKLLVMSASDDIFFLWLDAQTHEVVKRGVFRIARGQRVMVETYFSDFREVGGVLQPHRIETRFGERVLYLMVISRMEANPAQVTDAVFAAPAGWPELKPAPARAR